MALFATAWTLSWAFAVGFTGLDERRRVAVIQSPQSTRISPAVASISRWPCLPLPTSVRRAARAGQPPETPAYKARSTQIRLALARQRQQHQDTHLDGVGKYPKAIDKALPGQHKRGLYDVIKRREANVLTQLRTGMARINSYLHRIGAADTDMCGCGQALETMEHFLFRCTKWGTQRESMQQVAQSKMGNLSFFVGGKAASDGPKWAPNLQAVRAAIRFAMDTKRLDTDWTGRRTN